MDWMGEFNSDDHYINSIYSNINFVKEMYYVWLFLVNVNSTFFLYRSFIMELFVFIIEFLNCSGSY